MASTETESMTSHPFLQRGMTQNIVAGIVAFLGPGLFNAMQGE